MDVVAALRWSAFLLLAAGCQHQVMTVPNPSPLTTGDKAPPIDRSQIKPASAKAKELSPRVWVSAGDFKAGEAADPDKTPDSRQQIRELARADYEEALKLDPKCVPAYQGLARLAMSTRATQLAIETYQKALRIAPNNAQLWYELGMCHHADKDWESALSCLSRADQLNPHNSLYGNARAVVLAQCGRYDESLSCFIHCSGEAMGHYRLAQTLQRLQQPELSQHYLESALRIDPSLSKTLALNSGANSSAKSASASIQQTMYQDSSVPPDAAPPAPQTIPPDAPTAENAPQPQQVIPPPPPPVNVEYGQPQ